MKEEQIDVLRLIEEKYKTFTDAEKRIADFVLSNPRVVVESSITDLCKHANVKSEASVVKFYKKLNLNSFQQFKVLITQNISSTPLEILYEDVDENDSTKVVTEKIFKATVRALLDTMVTIDISTLEKAAELCRNSKRILFSGFAASAAVAFDAFHKFSRIGKDAIFSNDQHIMITLLATGSPDDVLIAISHTGETKAIIELVQKANKLGIPVIAITGQRGSTLTKYANVTLFTNTKETKIRTDAMTSRIVQLAILDTIYTLVAAHDTKAIEALNKSKLAVSELKF